MKAILNAFFPIDIACLLCGDLPEKGSCVCPKCLNDLPRNADFMHDLSGAVLYAPFWHQGGAQEMVHQLKYENKRLLAALMGGYMAAAVLEEYDMILPVPLSKKRLRKRGYNQAELLAKAAGDVLRLPIFRALERFRHTREQVGLNAREREENIKGAFRCADIDIENKRLLLVDDVFTSGSTARECIRALMEKGSKRVDVLTFTKA